MELCCWFLFDMQPGADCFVPSSESAAPLPHRAVVGHQKYSGRRQEKRGQNQLICPWQLFCGVTFASPGSSVGFLGA